VIGRSWRILQVLQSYDVNQDTMRMKHEAFAIAIEHIKLQFDYLHSM
jgi:ribosomal protein L15E